MLSLQMDVISCYGSAAPMVSGKPSHTDAQPQNNTEEWFKNLLPATWIMVKDIELLYLAYNTMDAWKISAGQKLPLFPGTELSQWVTPWWLVVAES